MFLPHPKCVVRIFENGIALIARLMHLRGGGQKKCPSSAKEKWKIKEEEKKNKESIHEDIW